MEKIKVDFNAGESRKRLVGCNYMLAVIETEDGTIELYAEVLESDYDDFNPDDINDFDDYSYPILKEEIISQAIENDIDIERLEFWWG